MMLDTAFCYQANRKLLKELEDTKKRFAFPTDESASPLPKASGKSPPTAKAKPKPKSAPVNPLRDSLDEEPPAPTVKSMTKVMG